MARVELITERVSDLTDEQAETFDYIVETRGKMIRPFEVLLHSPGLARSIAELGSKVRFESSLDDHDRELVILTVGITHGCEFVWNSHIDLGRSVGIRTEVLDGLRDGSSVELTDHEALLVESTRELCTSGTLSTSRFAALIETYGDAGTVEFTVTIGYYTMLGFVMGAADAC